MKEEVYSVIWPMMMGIVAALLGVISWLFKKSLGDIEEIKKTLHTLEGKIAMTDHLMKRIDKAEEKQTILSSAVQSAHKRLDSILTKKS
jgi:hypothetical protein